MASAIVMANAVRNRVDSDFIFLDSALSIQKNTTAEINPVAIPIQALESIVCSNGLMNILTDYLPFAAIIRAYAPEYAFRFEFGEMALDAFG